MLLFTPKPTQETTPMTSDTPQDALASLSEGIALLIDLAKQGEIDPWDVRVIEVIDRYLSQLTPGLDSVPNNQFVELSESGQAFLYASMLVLLKADSLMNSDAPGDDDAMITEELEFLGSESETEWLRPQNLERQLRRRAVAKVPQKRQVTLQELIDQLQLMAATIAQHQSRPRPRRNVSVNKNKALKAIAELAHEENLVEMAGKLDELLRAEGVGPQGDWLELEQLLVMWSNLISKQKTQIPNHVESTNLLPVSHSQHDRVGVFWALLLLSAQSKVELSQDEFYQDIKVRTLNISPQPELNNIR